MIGFGDEMNTKMKKIYSGALFLLALAALYFLIPGGARDIKPPKNIVFMLFDTMRADRLSPYGYKRDTSPAMAGVAEDGVTFEKAFSQSGWTLPSVASFFSGAYPIVHGARDMKASLPQQIITMAEHLGYSGYKCVGASNNPLVSRDREMHQGFRNWLDKVRDPAVTHYGLSWLNEHDINYYRLWKENLLSNYSFEDMLPNLKKKGSHYKYGYFDRLSFATSRRELGREGNVILSVNRKEIPVGNYHWGLAVKGLGNNDRIKVWLRDQSSGGDILDERIITADSEWKMEIFQLKIDRPVKRLLMFMAFEDNKGDAVSRVAVDDLFFLPSSKRNDTEKRFIYLHYINPHEPHKMPEEVKGIYNGLFTGDPGNVSRISESPGDLHDLINVKFLLHKHRIRSWIKVADRIGVQENSYDREIRYMDDQVHKMVEYLKATGQYDDTMIILTSDHGDEFLDHGHISHMLSVYNELIHVPLIISYPAEFPEGMRVENNVSSLDIFQTFYDLFGAPKKLAVRLDGQLSGRSLLPLIYDKESGQKRVIFSTDYITRQTAVIYGDRKLIQRKSDCGDKSTLFDLENDFGETRDISADEPELSKMLEERILRSEEAAAAYRKRWLDKVTTRKQTDPDQEKMKKGLYDLGYIDAVKNVFDLSRQFEDSYCNLLKARKQIKSDINILLAHLFPVVFY